MTQAEVVEAMKCRDEALRELQRFSAGDEKIMRDAREAQRRYRVAHSASRERYQTQLRNADAALAEVGVGWFTPATEVEQRRNET